MGKKFNWIVFFKYVVLVIIAIFAILLPFWSLIINSTKTLKEATYLGLGFPAKWNIIENYKTVFIDGKFLMGFLNSLFLTIASVVIVLLLASLAAWIFARSKSKIVHILYYVAISGLVIPPALVTSIKLLKAYHIYGSYVGLLYFYIGLLMSLSIFFITGFIKTIPVEMEEAARIDGCSSNGVFFKIIFPSLKPILITTSIFLGLSVWNDFIYPFYFLTHTYQWTLTMGLYNFISYYMYTINWNLVFADVVVISMPILIVYFFAQKRILSGLMQGSIK